MSVSSSHESVTSSVVVAYPNSSTAPVVKDGGKVATDASGTSANGFPTDAGHEHPGDSYGVSTSSAPDAVQTQSPNPQSAAGSPTPAAAHGTQLATAENLPATTSMVTQSAADAGAATQATATSTGPTTGPAAAPLASGVPMQEMIDAIHATVAMAARQGIAQARIELQPEELGQISIRLSQTSSGLSVRVSADTAAGTQALTQSGSELRQSLSSLGVSLLRLDIGSSGQSQTYEQGERFSGQTSGSNASTSAIAANDNESLDEPDSEPRPLGVARGEIVDVLA